MEQRLRHILIICLGGFWVLDGILQFQPAMFTSAFVNNVLSPNLQGQPAIITGIIAFGIHLWSFHMVWSNLAAASMQLLIGALLVLPWKDNVKRFGLLLSIAWALIIWIFGEGLGNLMTGNASFYTGAPGAALLYLILAIFLIYSQKLPLQKLPLTVGVLFLMSATLNFAPMFWQPTMLSMIATVPAVSGWLGTFSNQGTIIGNLLATGILMCLGIFLFLAPNRPIAWVTTGFLLVVWWIGQNFGGILTFPNGTGTDPNSALLFTLFLLPIFFRKEKTA